MNVCAMSRSSLVEAESAFYYFLSDFVRDKGSWAAKDFDGRRRTTAASPPARLEAAAASASACLPDRLDRESGPKKAPPRTTVEVQRPRRSEESPPLVRWRASMKTIRCTLRPPPP